MLNMSVAGMEKLSGNPSYIDTRKNEHESYLKKFTNKITDKLRNLIESHISNDPDVIKGRKKTVQEIFYEHATHLRILSELQTIGAFKSSTLPARLRSILLNNVQNYSRHAPYFILGGHGSGKSALIIELYREVNEWFGAARVHRIIRFAGATPRSAYNLELLRVICQQISIIFDIPEGYLPKDASFDPVYINSWFQSLLRRIEDMKNDILFLFIDDLHLLNAVDFDIAAALSWLPTSLPWNVQIICSSTISLDQLKFTPMQRDRFKCRDYMFDLSSEENCLELAKPKSAYCKNEGTIQEFLERHFDVFEQLYSKKGFGRLATYISCSAYGLTETELLELLMPTGDAEAFIDVTNGNFNFSSFKKIRSEMNFLLRYKVMSGKVLIEWSHIYCKEIAKMRYMDSNTTRSVHNAIAKIFFQSDYDEDVSSGSETEANVITPQESKLIGFNSRKITPYHPDNASLFYNPITYDVSYSMRHVEESWHHLMRSDDIPKFKQIAVCNFDFLLAAIYHNEISYYAFFKLYAPIRTPLVQIREIGSLLDIAVIQMYVA